MSYAKLWALRKTAYGVYVQASSGFLMVGGDGMEWPGEC